MSDADSSMSEVEELDLFILHASAEADTRFVHTHLLPILGVSAVRVLLSSRLPPGQRVVDAVERALLSSKLTILLVTPDFLRESWASYSEALASYSAAHGAGALIPVLLSSCELPIRLKMWVAVDVRDPDRRDRELLRLRDTLRARGLGAPPRAEPDRPPLPATPDRKSVV
jgi:hypothetical protein